MDGVQVFVDSRRNEREVRVLICAPSVTLVNVWLATLAHTLGAQGFDAMFTPDGCDPTLAMGEYRVSFTIDSVPEYIDRHHTLSADTMARTLSSLCNLLSAKVG